MTATTRQLADVVTADARPEVLRDPRAQHHPRWQPGVRLHHVFEQVCDALVANGRADQVAVETATAGGVRGITYLQLDAQANRLARYLIAMGVRPGDRVALLLDEPVLAFPAILAVLKAHAAYVPLDAGYPQDRLAYILADAGIGLVLTRGGLRPLVESTGVVVINVDEIDETLAALPGYRLGPGERQPPADELAYIIYTSGSTGRPKGVAVEHASICNFVRVAAEVYGIRPDDRMYQGMTIAFDFSFEEIWVPWMSGATLVPRPPGGSLLGADLHAFLRQRRVTAMACVPTLLATIDDDLPELRFLLVSGEACPRDLVARWWRPDRRFLNVYGPTEATVTATWTPLHPDRPVTIGAPLPTYTCVVLDPETGQLLPPESTGELGIAGIGLAVGYVNRPDLTAKAFVPDPIGLSDNPSGRIYRTGDLVRSRRDGEIEYLGRIDLQVKIRGYRIELTEIESVLMRAPGVAQAVVTTHSAQPDLVELAAFVSRRRDVARLDLDQVLGFLRDRLPPYMVPAYLEELAAIPLLPSDKADRKALPVPRRRAGASSGGVAARTDTEAALAALVGETLGLPEVGVDRHLFDDLGGNSLLMAQFSARVRRDPRLPALSMRDIYLNPTIERLAARADALQAATPSQPPVTMPGGLPALPTAEQPDAGSRRPRHSRLAYAATGIAQLAVMLLGLWAAAAMAVKAYVFVSGAPTLLSAYQRAVLATVLLTALMSAGPIAAKWILVGRWKAQEIPLWSLAHLRFWLAARLQVLSPLGARVGSPLQVLHLRALGARIGPGVVLLTRGPVCTDLVSIGAGTIVRQGALLSTYRPENGRLRTGSITLGQDVVVGEQCILDIDTAMAAGSRLLHASSLQRGQAVPAGEVWHGSPGRPMDGPAPPMPVQPFSAARRIVYPTLQLLWTLLFWGPLAFAAIKLPLTRFALDGGSTAWLHLNPQSAADLVSAPFASQLLIAAAAIYGLVIAIGLLAVLTVPRVLNLGLRPETDYPVLGWRFALARAVTRSTNVKFQMQLFGDSSYILGYLRALGWRVDRAEQSGSNFGVSQRHETPYLVSVGRGTMVSDGLAVLNSEYSATAFRLRRVDIGATCFFGNNVAYPADARTGDNCLFGTKVAVPVNGPVRHGTGLLGSPAFEIPRSVARDAAFPELRRPAVRAQRLRRKNRHNLRTMAAFLALGWFRLAVALYSAFAASVLPVGDSTRVAVAGVLASVSGLVVSVLVERTVLLFRPLKPRFCSIYDPAFWRHERYWKLILSGPLAVLAGTPMRPLLLRALGAKVGKGVFDDGCGMPERSLVTIGDWTCLAAGTTVQGHSLEDGTFKSDHIVIGSHVTLGVGAFVHYGTVVGDGALIEADSFLMKGEEVPPRDRWVGNPAQPAPAQLKDADGVGTSVDARRVDLGPAASTSLPSRAGRALEALGVAASMPFESGGVRLAVLDLNRGDRDVAALPLDILDAADHAEMLLITDWARRDADGAGRVLARLCLSAWWYPEIEPSAWCFARTPTGRLDVVGPVPGLHLSVSHAGQVVAVATSDRGPVGVDVETEPDTVAALSGASAALTDGEQARLRAAPPDGSGPLFLQMWTLKEATAKALGRATVIDLRSIETSLSPPAALVTADSLGDGTQPAPSAFRQLQLTVGSRTYWLSVAVTEPMSRGIPATRQLAHGHADAVGTRARPIRHRRVSAPGAASRIDRRRQAGIVKLIKVIYVLVGLTVTWQRGYLTPTVVKTLLSAALHVMLWFLLLLGIDPHVP